MPKCDFNKVALQLYWHGTSVWVLLNDYHIFLIAPLVFTDCYSMRFITLSSYISLINDVILIFVYLIWWFDSMLLLQQFDTGNRWIQIHIDHNPCITSEHTNQVRYSYIIHSVPVIYYHSALSYIIFFQFNSGTVGRL